MRSGDANDYFPPEWDEDERVGMAEHNADIVTRMSVLIEEHYGEQITDELLKEINQLAEETQTP